MQTSYVRVITSNGVCSDDTSGTLTINVVTPPTNTIALGDTLCTGDSRNFSGRPAKFWNRNITPINGRLDRCPLQYSPIFQIQIPKILDMSAYSTNTVFRRVVTSGPCTTVSNEAFLAFNPVPSISVVTSADVDCNGNSSGSISIAAVNAIFYSIDNGTTYQNSPNFNGLVLAAIPL